MTIGEKIKKARKKANMTQKVLGEKCGIHEANIRKYENGRQNPKYETLKKIADALNVPVYELLTNDNVMAIRPPDELKDFIKEYAKKHGMTINSCVLNILWDFQKSESRK